MGDDQQVIRRVLQGDREAFRVLVHRYQGPLFALIRNLIGDAHEAEDIAQEVFLAAYVRLASFDPARAAFATWLFTIARNRCVNALQKKRPQAHERPPEQADHHAPTDNLEEGELHRQLDAALAALPPDQKAVFVLAELHELPLAEVARIEGVRLGTVKSRLNRAREKLRALLRRAAEPR